MEKTRPSVSFSKAIQEGLLEDVKYYVEIEGRDIYDDEECNCALHDAAERGYEEIVRYMFEAGDGDIALCGSWGTLLTASVLSDNLSLIRYVVEELGADLDAVNGEAALHVATRYKSLETVRYLLERGANPNVEDDAGKTPLFWAFDMDRPDEYLQPPKSEEEEEEKLALTRALVESGASVRGILSAALPYSERCVAYLIEKGAAGDDGDGISLWEAATAASPSLVRYWIERLGADVSATDEKGRTPLHCVALAEDFARDYGGDEYYYLANARRAYETAAYLLDEAGADLFAKDAEGRSPLEIAESEEARLAKFLRFRSGRPEPGDEDFLEDLASSPRPKPEPSPLWEATRADDAATLERLLSDAARFSNVGRYERNALIFWTLEKERWDLFDRVLTLGADVAVSGSKRRTPLHFVAEKGTAALVDRLTALGADASALDANGKTPLRLAVEAGNAATIARLFDVGADPWKRETRPSGGCDGMSAFGVALSIDDVDFVAACAERFPERFASAEDRDAYFEIAARNNSTGVIRFLLERFQEREEEEKQTKRLRRTLSAAAERGDLALLKSGVEDWGALEKIAAADKEGEKRWGRIRSSAEYAFIGAARGNAVDVAKYLVERCGVDVAKKDLLTEALFAAARADALDAAKYLVDELNADPTARRLGAATLGGTALHEAAETGATAVAEFLLDRGADVSDAKEYGETPLHVAIEEGRIETARLLIERGADVNARAEQENWYEKGDYFPDLSESAVSRFDKSARREYWDWSWDAANAPLHVAAYKNDKRAIELLVENGADLNAWNKRNETPFLVAASRGHWGLVWRWIKSGDVDISARDKDGVSALEHFSVRGGWRDVARLLKENWCVDAEEENVAAQNETTSPPDAEKEESEKKENAAEEAEKKTLEEFFKAAEKGKVEEIRRFVESGVDVNVAKSWGETALHRAAKKDRLEAVRYLVDAGADVEKATDKGRTPLFEAARYNALSVVRYLLEEANASFEREWEGKKRSAFDEAATYEKWRRYDGGNAVDVVRYFVEERNVDFTDAPERKTAALRVAVEEGTPEILRRWLDERGFDANARNAEGETATHWAARSESEFSAETLRYLLEERKLDPNAKNLKGETPLHWAAASGSLENAKILVENGASVDAKDGEGKTPLGAILRCNVLSPFWSVRSLKEEAKLEVVRYLIETCGAELSPEIDWVAWAAANLWKSFVEYLLDERGLKPGNGVGNDEKERYSALHFAASMRWDDVVRRLIAAGADVAARDAYGRTPLHYAYYLGEPLQIVDALLDAGAPVDARDNDGATPLHFACCGWGEDDEAFERTLAARPNLAFCNAQKETVALLAARLGIWRWVPRLVDAGTPINAANERGETLLHLAAATGARNYVRGLIQRGADPTLRDVDGKTPFDRAGSDEVREYLRAFCASRRRINEVKRRKRESGER